MIPSQHLDADSYAPELPGKELQQHHERYLIGNALFGYEADTRGISLNVKDFTNQRYYVEANAAGAVLDESLGAFLKVYIKQ